MTNQLASLDAFWRVNLGMYLILYNSPSYSRILIGSLLRSTIGQIHDDVITTKFFLLHFKMAESFEK